MVWFGGKNGRYDVFVWFSFNYSLLTLTEKSRRELKLKTLWFTVNNKNALCSFAHNSIFAPNQTLINLRKNDEKRRSENRGGQHFTHIGYSEPHTHTHAHQKKNTKNSMNVQFGWNISYLLFGGRCANVDKVRLLFEKSRMKLHSWKKGSATKWNQNVHGANAFWTNELMHFIYYIFSANTHFEPVQSNSSRKTPLFQLFLIPITWKKRKKKPTQLDTFILFFFCSTFLSVFLNGI